MKIKFSLDSKHYKAAKYWSDKIREYWDIPAEEYKIYYLKFFYDTYHRIPESYLKEVRAIPYTRVFAIDTRSWIGIQSKLDYKDEAGFLFNLEKFEKFDELLEGVAFTDVELAILLKVTDWYEKEKGR